VLLAALRLYAMITTPYAPCLEPLSAAGTALFDAARDAGAVRADFAAADLVPLMCGIAHAVDVHGGAAADRVATAHGTSPPSWRACAPWHLHPREAEVPCGGGQSGSRTDLTPGVTHAGCG
jgi:hypothetical protein